MTRSEFIKSAGAAAVLAASGKVFAETAPAGGAVDYAALQQ